MKDVNVEHKIFDLPMTFQRVFSRISNAGQVVDSQCSIFVNNASPRRDRLTDPEVPGPIPDATRFSEK
jgi:hypothetical protein